MSIPKDNKIISDLSKMASSTVATIVNIKNDLATYIKQQVKAAIKNMDFVSKQDFAALKKAMEHLRAEMEELKASSHTHGAHAHHGPASDATKTKATADGMKKAASKAKKSKK